MPTASILASLALVFSQTAPMERTLAQTEALARTALATLLHVAESTIATAETAERTWADAQFECAPRKGVFEPVPTPGYRVVLTHDGRRYEYRADRVGTVRRCVARGPTGKPASPRKPGR